MPHIHEKIDFTASVYVVNGDAVLLRKHEKFDRWLQPGGHIELDEDPMEAALREVKEETGLEVALIGERPTASQGPGFRHLIPPRFLNRHDFHLKPGHEHIDFVYFGTSASREAAPGEGVGEHERLAELRWFTYAQLQDPAHNLWGTVKFYAETALRELGR